MSNKARILVVDDEARYTRTIKTVLEGEGYEVITAPDGRRALELAADEKLDLILLDVRMPGPDGYETCQSLREFSMTPVILLTALADEADKIRGLDAGADDYVTKPFSAGELTARVRAVLRRATWSEFPAAQPVLQAGHLLVDFERHRVFSDDQEVRLTRTEYRLLCELAREPGKIFTPEYLLQRVWGAGYRSDTRLVRQVIHRLRQKIECNPAEPKIIQSQAGLGYFFVLP